MVQRELQRTFGLNSKEDKLLPGNSDPQCVKLTVSSWCLTLSERCKGSFTYLGTAFWLTSPMQLLQRRCKNNPWEVLHQSWAFPPPLDYPLILNSPQQHGLWSVLSLVLSQHQFICSSCWSRVQRKCDIIELGILSRHVTFQSFDGGTRKASEGKAVSGLPTPPQRCKAAMEIHRWCLSVLQQNHRPSLLQKLEFFLHEDSHLPKAT